MRLAIAGNVQQLRRKSLVGQAIVTLVALKLLFLGTFAAVPLPTGTASNLRDYLHNKAVQAVAFLPERWQEKVKERWPELNLPQREVRFSFYVPQAPLAVFVGYVLGWPLGFAAASVYFILGLVGSRFGIFAFAGGGGLNYWREPSFGYLVGVVAASALVGVLTQGNRSSMRQLASVVAGLTAVHLIGTGYLIASFLAGGIVDAGQPATDWHQWVSEEIRNLTWYPLTYDILFSFVAVGLGFPFRWLVNTLTAPDIALKPRPQPSLDDI